MFSDAAKVGQPQDIARLATQLANLEKAHFQLQKAFDAFFDLVVEELGYKAATFMTYGFGHPALELTASPRQLAMTQPEPKLIRTKKVSK